MKRKLLVASLLSLFILFFSGCMYDNSEAMFVLPQPTEEHKNLQDQLNAAMADGWEYSPPLSGDNRTAVQFLDLTGDGEDEAVVFLKRAQTLELSVLVFQLKNDLYYQYANLVMSGDSFDRVVFDDMNGDGVKEVLVGLRFGSETLYSASVYSIDGENETTKLLDAKYTDWYLYDMDEDGLDNLLILQNDETGKNAVAILYGYSSAAKGSLTLMGKAPLSAGVIKPERVVGGEMGGGIKAVAIDSKYRNEGYITDVLAYSAKNLMNLSFVPAEGVSKQFIRPLAVLSGDLNLDGRLEVPAVAPVSGYGGFGADVKPRCDWYRYTAGFSMEYVYSTYNDIDNGWYVDMPAVWRYAVNIAVVEQNDEYRKTVFYRSAEVIGENNTLLTVMVYYGAHPKKLYGDGEVVIASRSDALVTAIAGTGATKSGGLLVGKDELKNIVIISAKNK